jgi:hypothetical protein
MDISLNPGISDKILPIITKFPSLIAVDFTGTSVSGAAKTFLRPHGYVRVPDDVLMFDKSKKKPNTDPKDTNTTTTNTIPTPVTLITSETNAPSTIRHTDLHYYITYGPNFRFSQTFGNLYKSHRCIHENDFEVAPYQTENHGKWVGDGYRDKQALLRLVKIEASRGKVDQDTDMVGTENVATNNNKNINYGEAKSIPQKRQIPTSKHPALKKKKTGEFNKRLEELISMKPK